MWIVPVLVGVLIGAWIVQQIWMAQEIRHKHPRHPQHFRGDSRVALRSSGTGQRQDTFASLILETNPTVFVTRTGSRYHLTSCHYLHRSQIPIRLFEAVLRGYTPCAHCRQILIKEQLGNQAPTAEAPHLQAQSA